MAQDCLACFAAFVAPASAGSRFAGFRYCTRNAPQANSTNPDAWIWPKVEEDWTCREGADAVTGLSYANTVNGQPGTGGAGPGYLATSTTSATIGASGSKALTTQLNLAYTAGARVRASSGVNWMEGVVASYDATGLLTFTADLASGSGTFTSWDINLAGEPGGAGGIASSGTFTCGATRPIVVANAAVLAGSKVLLTAADVTAAQCVAGTSTPTVAHGIFHDPALNVAGVSFTVDSGDGQSFAGTEVFEYAIVN